MKIASKQGKTVFCSSVNIFDKRRVSRVFIAAAELESLKSIVTVLRKKIQSRHSRLLLLCITDHHDDRLVVAAAGGRIISER